MARLDALTAERQRLRGDGAPSVKLERNRLEIARCQWQLSLALIERHCARPAHRNAA